MGAAPKWRLGLALAAWRETLEQKGSRLILRRGEALEVLRDLIAKPGRGGVLVAAFMIPTAMTRDKAVKEALKGDGHRGAQLCADI